MRIFKSLFFALLLSTFFIPDFSFAAEKNLTIGGRPVILFSPDNMENRLAPLLIMLHGGGGDATQFSSALNARPVSISGRFHVAYINGTVTVGGTSKSASAAPPGRTWNAGACCNDAKNKGVNDVAYIDSVIAYFIKQGITWKNDIYLLGHSNGAMMSYRYACERGNKVKAIIPISAAIVTDDVCEGMTGVKVLHIHGENDQSVPIAGGVPPAGTPALFRLTGPLPSLAQTRQMAIEAGAQPVDYKVIRQAEHSIDTLEAALQRQTGYDLMRLVFLYLDQSVDMFPEYTKRR